MILTLTVSLWQRVNHKKRQLEDRISFSTERTHCRNSATLGPAYISALRPTPITRLNVRHSLTYK